MVLQFVPIELDVLGVPKGDLAAQLDECENPPSADDLPNWEQEDYNLEARLAAKLGFGFGGLNMSSNQRLLVREFSRSKVCLGADGKRYRYGTAVRLMVKISNVSAGANLTLPFVAAETQFGRIEAVSSLRVVGYVGEELASILPGFRTFNVDAYGEMSAKMNDVKRLIGEDVKNVTPVKLGVEIDPSEAGADVNEALGLLWGLTWASKGKSCREASKNYPDRDVAAALRGIQDAYDSLPGTGGCDATKPTRVQKVFAQEQLRGMELTV